LELHRRTAGRRGVRLQPHRTARARPADREPSPEGPCRRRAPRAGAPWHLDVLPPRPRADAGAPGRAHAPGREAGNETIGMTRARRLVAEGVGTALLLAAVVGSGIMGERLAGGNVAVALLANTVATGAALV